MLGSKNISDVIETMRLLILMSKINIQGSDVGIRKMLVLIWSKEKTIQEELLKAYWSLYLNDKEFEHRVISKKLVNLLNSSTISEATSLEELLCHIIDWDHKIEEKDKEKKKGIYYIKEGVFKGLWEIFVHGLKKPADKDRLDARSALQILRITFNKKRDFLLPKFQNMLDILNSYKKTVSFAYYTILIKDWWNRLGAY
jgi:condensin complex subunit 1